MANNKKNLSQILRTFLQYSRSLNVLNEGRTEKEVSYFTNRLKKCGRELSAYLRVNSLNSKDIVETKELFESFKKNNDLVKLTIPYAYAELLLDVLSIKGDGERSQLNDRFVELFSRLNLKEHFDTQANLLHSKVQENPKSEAKRHVYDVFVKASKSLPDYRPKISDVPLREFINFYLTNMVTMLSNLFKNKKLNNVPSKYKNQESQNNNDFSDTKDSSKDYNNNYIPSESNRENAQTTSSKVSKNNDSHGKTNRL